MIDEIDIDEVCVNAISCLLSNNEFLTKLTYTHKLSKNALKQILDQIEINDFEIKNLREMRQEILDVGIKKC